MKQCVLRLDARAKRSSVEHIADYNIQKNVNK